MAIDILSIPPCSYKIKGVLSGIRRATLWERGSLHIDTVEIHELLWNWNKNGLVDEKKVEELFKKTAAAQ